MVSRDDYDVHWLSQNSVLDRVQHMWIHDLVRQHCSQWSSSPKSDLQQIAPAKHEPISKITSRYAYGVKWSFGGPKGHDCFAEVASETNRKCINSIE